MRVHITYDIECRADGWIDMGTRMPAVFRLQERVNAAIVRGHALMDRFFGRTGQLLERDGVTPKVRQLIRRHG